MGMVQWGHYHSDDFIAWEPDPRLRCALVRWRRNRLRRDDQIVKPHGRPGRRCRAVSAAEIRRQFDRV